MRRVGGGGGRCKLANEYPRGFFLMGAGGGTGERMIAELCFVPAERGRGLALMESERIH